MFQVALPACGKWKVAAADVVISGEVSSLIKRKCLFLSRTSPIRRRSMTVTRQGYLVIYDAEQKGYIVDLHDVRSIKMTAWPKQKKWTTGADSRIELKLDWGAVWLAVASPDVIAWIEAINRFAVTISTSTQQVVYKVGDYSRQQQQSAVLSTDGTYADTLAEDSSDSRLAFFSAIKWDQIA